MIGVFCHRTFFPSVLSDALRVVGRKMAEPQEQVVAPPNQVQGEGGFL